MRKITFLPALALFGLFSVTSGLAGDGKPVADAKAVVCETAKCNICVVSIPRTHPRPCKVKVCTEIIDRCTQTCEAKGPCGKIYEYAVTCITYKDVYSDGTTRIWKSSL